MRVESTGRIETNWVFSRLVRLVVGELIELIAGRLVRLVGELIVRKGLVGELTLARSLSLSLSLSLLSRLMPSYPLRSHLTQSASDARV